MVSNLRASQRLDHDKAWRRNTGGLATCTQVLHEAPPTDTAKPSLDKPIVSAAARIHALRTPLTSAGYENHLVSGFAATAYQPRHGRMGDGAHHSGAQLPSFIPFGSKGQRLPPLETSIHSVAGREAGPAYFNRANSLGATWGMQGIQAGDNQDEWGDEAALWGPGRLHKRILC